MKEKRDTVMTVKIIKVMIPITVITVDKKIKTGTVARRMRVTQLKKQKERLVQYSKQKLYPQLKRFLEKWE